MVDSSRLKEVKCEWSSMPEEVSMVYQKSSVDYTFIHVWSTKNEGV